MTTKLVGQPVQRVEDERFLRGLGRYVDDVAVEPHGQQSVLHAAVLRSPHAHARITGIDVDEVLDLDGVHAVYTYEDLTGPMAEPLPLLIPHPALTHGRTQYALAKDEVNYVGEAIAFVVADDRYVAEDAIDRIRVELRALPPVVGVEAARAARHLVHDDVPGNIGARLEQNVGDAPAAIATAPHRLELDLTIERSACTPLEGRGTVARWDRDLNRLQVWTSTQSSTGVRAAVAVKLGLDLGQVDVITPDVGGGFGVKINHPWPEELLVPLAARALGRTVKFTEDRREHFISAAHERGQVQHIEVGFDDDGRLLGLDVEFWHDHGAFIPYGLIVPIITSTQLLGPYKPQNYRVVFESLYTNTVMVTPYRGAGRPQGCYAMERTMDAIAAYLGKDRADVRAVNFIQPDEFPFDQGLIFQDGRELEYDSGDYPALWRRSRRWSAGRSSRRTRPRWRPSGTSGRDRPGLLRRGHRRRSLRGCARAHRDHRQGQGRDRVDHPGAGTRDGLRAAGRRRARLPVRGRRGGHRRHPPDAVRRRHLRLARRGDERLGDPPRDQAGEGEGPQDRRRGAGGVDPDDLQIVDGVVSVKGSPGSSIDLGTVSVLSNPLRYAFDEASKAATQFSVGDPGKPPVPEDEEPGLEGRDFYSPERATFASGMHAVIVETDPETAEITILKYAVVHDCGRLINPMIVEGQIHGGVAQGVGGALYERMVYDESGQLLNASFMDFLMPYVTEVPDGIDIDHLETPSPLNPLGIKGAGEAGVIPSAAVFAAAIEDAESDRPGLVITAMPISPSELYALRHRTRSGELMKIVGSNVIPFPVEMVWDALLDPRVLVATIPGCERLEAVSANAYDMTVTAGVASIKGTYKGSCELSDLQQHESLMMRLQGAGAPGTVDAMVQVVLR